MTGFLQEPSPPPGGCGAGWGGWDALLRTALLGEKVTGAAKTLSVIFLTIFQNDPLGGEWLTSFKKLVNNSLFTLKVTGPNKVEIEPPPLLSLSEGMVVCDKIWWPTAWHQTLGLLSGHLIRKSSVTSVTGKSLSNRTEARRIEGPLRSPSDQTKKWGWLNLLNSAYWGNTLEASHRGTVSHRGPAQASF